jgi:glycosyltransferase involved in cell wall biosynthesis
MKYPFIIFFRYSKYSFIDDWINKHITELECTLFITNNEKDLNKLYKQQYAFLLTYGYTHKEYIPLLTPFINSNNKYRLLHIDCNINWETENILMSKEDYKNLNILNNDKTIYQFPNIEEFNKNINSFYINLCTLNRSLLRPTFSIFTTTYNSFNKILRGFVSLQQQTMNNWEWIILDDSPNNENFEYMKENLINDSRIRIYKRYENNGYIGNVKNEAISLCRGEYVLELDHDDEILPDVLEDSVKIFTNKEVGFIYMDFINIFENGENFWYGNNVSKGYGSYYCQKIKNKWSYVFNTPNINNITQSHLTCCPNHPRIWRKSILLEMGNFCEYLPVCDDYEILLRTVLQTKIVKIPKIGYIQYMNNNNNNFSLIHNKEINRIGPDYISPIYFSLFKMDEYFIKHHAFESLEYLNDNTPIWQRGFNYKHCYYNTIQHPNIKRQVCFIGLDSLYYHLLDHKIDQFVSLLEKDTNNICYNSYCFNKVELIILDNTCNNEYLCKKIDIIIDLHPFLNNYLIKCFTLNESLNQLEKYFTMCILYAESYEIVNERKNNNIELPEYNSKLTKRHEVINRITEKIFTYLEIGTETGYTFNNTHFNTKVGIDPCPENKELDGELYIMSSNVYFDNILVNKQVSYIFDTIFIDGMHHCEAVAMDFFNSLEVLNNNGYILLDDVLPINYNEQLRTPIKHYYDKDILKYGEEWTGDVWKFVYELLKFILDIPTISYTYYHNPNYRGIICFYIVSPKDILIKKKIKDFPLDSNYYESKYNYFSDYKDYISLLQGLK